MVPAKLASAEAVVKKVEAACRHLAAADYLLRAAVAAYPPLADPREALEAALPDSEAKAEQEAEEPDLENSVVEAANRVRPRRRGKKYKPQL